MKTVLLVLFGVLLPAITLGIELSTGMCAQVFFDPIPTLGHVLLVAFVPLANLLALIGAHGTWTRWRTPLLWANGIVLGIALVYTMVFLPIMPLGLIAIIYLGMGFLPLAPLCAFLAAIALRMRLMKMPAAVAGTDGALAAAPSKSLGSLLGGGALGILLLLVMEAMVALTLIGVEMAASDSPGQAARGVSLLRRFGSRDELLRMCYWDGGRGRGPFSFGSGSRSMCGYLFAGVSREEAQRVFFHVTGLPYNSLPPPRGVSRAAWDEFDFDPDVGGEAVAGRRKGLLLNSSRIDANLQPDANVAYIEWIMVFQNDYWQQREARAQVLLPPGGVVSRVTLWVNGEPREAAFAGAAQTREAYKKVAIEQRRDPLLVTWAGNDRVLVQCFPIPAHGEMKIRLGITAPLVLNNAETTALRLPCFAERNFNITSRDIHSIWVESDRSCQHAPDRLHREKQGDAKHVLRGTLADEELASAGSTILTPRSANVTESWTPDLKNLNKYVVQKVVASQSPAKRQIVLVVDGSLGMADQFEAIASALAGVPADTKLCVLVAGDEVVEIPAADRSGDRSGSLAARLRDAAVAGVCDNVPALLHAFEEAAASDKTIIWVHASQPVLLQPVTPLVHWLERGAQVTIHDVAVAGGPNRLVEKLENLGCLQTVPRLGSVHDDLEGLLARLTGQAKDYRLERSQIEGKLPAKPKASSHIARLWAAGRVVALARSGKPAERTEAVNLASAYQLVTPASGAVVLENQRQYDESKLHPADPDSVPITPEPATWILVLTALPWLLWSAWRRRFRKTA